MKLLDGQTGGVDIPNASRGHLELRFNGENDQDVADAQRHIEDCLERGYLVSVEIDGEHLPVTKFDKDRNVYFIAGGPTSNPTQTEAPLKESKATVVAPIAGG
jgi:hypothetical protein